MVVWVHVTMPLACVDYHAVAVKLRESFPAEATVLLPHGDFY